MRPILFNKNEQSFDTYGLGELNVTKGTVTRERNGNYTLYSEIPANDPATAILEKEMKLKADAGLRTKNQTFEISRIVKDSSNIVKIYGQHISHKLEYMVLRNATAFNGSAFSALSIWRGALIGDLRFDVWSDIQTTGKGVFDISKMENARQALGGVEGSILDIYGGEYEFDNMTVRLHKQLGRTAPTVLEYGRNILSVELDETIESAYTSVLPFATYTPDKPEGDTSDSQSDPVTVTLPEDYVDSKYKALYAHRRIKVVDFSSEFKSDSKSKDIPTPDKLRKMANDYMERNAIGKPKINTKVDYVDLAKTLDYADNGWIEELELCDIVPIYYPQIGLTDETAKVTTVTYDFVNERNESVEFGDIGTNVRATMQSGLAGKVDDIAKAQQDFENSLPDYLLNAQGNKVWYNRPDNSEHKVGDIWFEKNGIYDRMYVWNGSQWEKRIDTEDIDRVKKEVDKQISDAQASTTQAIAQANAKAEEALKKAGTLPDTSKLSDQIKQQILSSPDLQNKVTEVVKSVDGDTIYSKIVTKLSNNFADKNTVNGLLRDTSNIYDKVDRQEGSLRRQTLEFNKLTESNKVFERILGTSETGAPDKLSRLVMSSEIFQTEVGKYVTSDNNLIVNSETMDQHVLVNENRPGVNVSVNNGIFTIKVQGLTSWNWSGFTLPIYVRKIYRGETYSVGFKYRVRGALDDDFNVIIKNHVLNRAAFIATAARSNTPVSDEWKEFQGTFYMSSDFEFGNHRNLPFYVYLTKNGWVEIKEIMLVRGSRTGPYKPSQFDDAFAETKAVRTQMSLLAGSWAVRNLNSNGDVLNSINVLADGTNRIDGRLTHITGQTKIDKAVIKDGMIANLNADKITGGTIDASQVNVINVNANNVLAGTLTGMTMRGGIIEAINGAMRIDLSNANTDYFQNATVSFWGDNNAIKRVRNDVTGFLHFADDEWNGVYAGLGVTSHNVGIDSSKTARFAGIKIWRSDDKHDKSEVYGDFITLKHEFRGNTGYNFQPAAATKMHNMTYLINRLEQFADYGSELSDLGNLSKRVDLVGYFQWINQRIAHLGNALNRKDIFYLYPGIGAK